ncbi:helix-turn-helix domain-containing protein [Salipiger bermudensis]|uniref:helix-turn-helix domain-containing protein n=1 Tax=Salipiger bermudensis TaxID=344736 RepID=UPI001A907151|nr:helix-turn-helix domain-containing protein [Salipiger bermudensis]MBN9674610.1 helix-turn-helix domain-containing protein [Salipiger bermudensis]
MPTTLDFAPRLMPVTQAAHYIGVSPSKLRDLPIPRRQLGGKRVYDRADLDAYADSLPYDGHAPITAAKPKAWKR